MLELTASDGKANSAAVVVGPFRLDTRPSGPPILLNVQAGGVVTLDAASRLSLSFSVADVASDPVDVTIEYQAGDGLRPALSDASLVSSRLDGLATRPLDASPPGVEHHFVWDLSGVSRPANLRLRVTARDLREGFVQTVEVGALENVRAASSLKASAFGSSSRCRSLSAGKLNADASQDLVWAQEDASYFGNVGVLLTTPGVESFGVLPATTLPASGSVWATALADLSGDGALDIVALTQTEAQTSSLDVWVGNGNGTFQTRIEPHRGQQPEQCVGDATSGCTLQR